MMHEHAQTWSVLKTLYGMTGGSGTSSAALGSNPKSSLAAGSHGSGGGQSTTGNPEPLSGKTLCWPYMDSIFKWELLNQNQTNNQSQRRKKISNGANEKSKWKQVDCSKRKKALLIKSAICLIFFVWFVDLLLIAIDSPFDWFSLN